MLGAFESRNGMLHVTDRRIVLEGPKGESAIPLDAVDSIAVYGKGRMQLVWGDPRQIENIHVKGAPAVAASIRKALGCMDRRVV